MWESQIKKTDEDMQWKEVLRRQCYSTAVMTLPRDHA